MLLQTCHDSSLAESLRTSAASQFKQVVSHRWSLLASVKESVNYVEVKAEEKASLRGNILGALVTNVVPVRNLLEDALRVIVSVDYPAHWTSLPDEIMGALNTDSQEQIVAALVALRAVIKRFDNQDVSQRSDMIAVAESTFPILKNLLEYLMANDSAESQEVQILILKVVWDGTMYGIPPGMQDPEVFDSWMQKFMHIFSQPVPHTAQMDSHAYFKLPWWQTKKWVLHFWIRLTTRFLRASASKPTDSAQFKDYFVNTWPHAYLEKAFVALAEISNGAKWPPRVLCSLLDFMHTALTFSQLWQQIKPHCWDIIKGVFLPMLCFNEDDLYLFDCEPDTYISNQLDPLVDEMNPRTPALTFMYDLAKYREPTWLQEYMAFLVTDVFQPYAQAPTADAKLHLASTKYAGMDIVGTLSELLKNDEAYASTLEEMLTAFIVPDLYDAPAWLRAKACWVFSRFCRIEFSDAANLVAGLEGILKNMLEAEELPLVADAAVALFDLIPNASCRPILGPMVPQLVDKYLSIMAHVDNDAIVGSLQYLMRYFPSPMRKSAVSLMHNLSTAFLRADHNSNQISLGDDTEADNAFMAASQTIRAIHTLYKSIRKSPALYAALEPLVTPVLKIGFAKNGVSYIEDCLALMTEVTYFMPPPFSPAMWEIFDMLCHAFMNWAPDYMQTILPSLDNFISRDKEGFLANPDKLEKICAFATKYFADPKYPELDLLPLTRVFEVLLLEHMGHIDHIIEPLLKLTIDRLAMGGTVPLKVTLLELVMNCMYYNAALTLHVLEAHEWTADVLKTTFDLIVSDAFERVCDKKAASLGIGAMLRVPMHELPPYVQEKFVEIVTTYMQLTQQSEGQRIAQEENADEDEEDYDDAEWDEEGDEELDEADDDEDDDWGEMLDSDEDDEEDEEQLEQAIAMMKAQLEDEGEELEADDLHAISGTTRQIGDSEDLPDQYGAGGNLVEKFIEANANAGWTLTGQEASTELPTDDIHEIVFLAETLHHMDEGVKNQLLASFTPEMMQLYEQLMEVANDKVERKAFEDERKAEKEAKKAELRDYYAAKKQGQ